jgi:heme-degrading monooxygenase HmoA
MFTHLSIHHPKAGQEQFLIESMQRFAAAMQGQPGLQQAYTLRDGRTGTLVGLAIWDSREAMTAARPAMAAATVNDDFDAWEEGDPEVFHLEAI